MHHKRLVVDPAASAAAAAVSANDLSTSFIHLPYDRAARVLPSIQKEHPD